MTTIFDTTLFIAPWLQAKLDTATTGGGGVAGPSFLRLFTVEACFSDAAATTSLDNSVFVGFDERATLSPFCSDNPVLALLHSRAHIDAFSGRFVLYFGKLVSGGPTRVKNRIKGVDHALPGTLHRLPADPASFVAHWKLHVEIDEARARASPICEQLARFFGPHTPEFRSKYNELAVLREPLSRIVLATGEHTIALAQLEWALSLCEPWRATVGNLQAVLAYIRQLTFSPSFRDLPIYGRPGALATYDEMVVVSAMATMATIEEKSATAARKRSHSTSGEEEEEEHARKSRRVEQQ